MAPPRTLRRIRKLANERLHEYLSDRNLDPTTRSLMERDMRRREQWSHPAGWAFWISVAALVVSVVAAYLSSK